jgi:tetratricopeptide (TPR) repeat protein
VIDRQHHTLAYCLLENRAFDEAVIAARCAVQMCEQSEANPVAQKQKLAMTLSTLSTCLGCVGGHGSEAAATVSRAVAICRDLAKENPEKWEPDLALALNNMAETFATSEDLSSNIGQLEEAAKAAEEALRLIKPYFLARQAVYAERTGMILKNLCRYVRLLDRQPDETLVAPIIEAPR